MNELTVLPQNTLSAPRPPIKRILAHMMKKAGRGELFVEAMGKKMRYDAYLSLMLWDAATTGTMYFADGRMMSITEIKDWLDLVKFLSQHIDGPSSGEATFNGVNIFKVYRGINEDQV